MSLPKLTFAAVVNLTLKQTKYIFDATQSADSLCVQLSTTSARCKGKGRVFYQRGAMGLNQHITSGFIKESVLRGRRPPTLCLKSRSSVLRHLRKNPHEVPSPVEPSGAGRRADRKFSALAHTHSICLHSKGITLKSYKWGNDGDFER